MVTTPCTSTIHHTLRPTELAVPILAVCAGVEHCINSDGILELDEVPDRLGIIGGGYIGVEFGGAALRRLI